MNKIGLVGGLSWVSTMDYYKFINEGTNAKLGGLNFAEVIIHSLNFGDIQAKGWNYSFELLLNACKSLQKYGVSSIVLCANTAHMFASELQEQIDVPIIHIVTETAKVVKKNGFKKSRIVSNEIYHGIGFLQKQVQGIRY